MRCFVAVATGQSRFKFLGKLWNLGEKEIKDIWKATKKGPDHTISFLRSNVGIESSDWMPSIDALVPLVVFYSKNSHVSSAEERKMLFWYYSASMWGRYSSSTETKLDQDLDMLVDKESGKLKANALESMIKN